MTRSSRGGERTRNPPPAPTHNDAIASGKAAADRRRGRIGPPPRQRTREGTTEQAGLGQRDQAGPRPAARDGGTRGREERRQKGGRHGRAPAQPRRGTPTRGETSRRGRTGRPNPGQHTGSHRQHPPGAVAVPRGPGRAGRSPSGTGPPGGSSRRGRGPTAPPPSQKRRAPQASTRSTGTSIPRDNRPSSVPTATPDTSPGGGGSASATGHQGRIGGGEERDNRAEMEGPPEAEGAGTRRENRRDLGQSRAARKTRGVPPPHARAVPHRLRRRPDLRSKPRSLPRDPPPHHHRRPLHATRRLASGRQRVTPPRAGQGPQPGILRLREPLTRRTPTAGRPRGVTAAPPQPAHTQAARRPQPGSGAGREPLAAGEGKRDGSLPLLNTRLGRPHRAHAHERARHQIAHTGSPPTPDGPARPSGTLPRLREGRRGPR